MLEFPGKTTANRGAFKSCQQNAAATWWIWRVVKGKQGRQFYLITASEPSNSNCSVPRGGLQFMTIGCFHCGGWRLIAPDYLCHHSLLPSDRAKTHWCLLMWSQSHYRTRFCSIKSKAHCFSLPLSKDLKHSLFSCLWYFHKQSRTEQQFLWGISPAFRRREITHHDEFVRLWGDAQFWKQLCYFFCELLIS